MKHILRTLAVCAMWLIVCGTQAAKPTEAQQVRQLIDKVNRQWQSTHTPETNSFWHHAAYHTGNMEAYFLTGNKSTCDSLRHGLSTTSGKEPRAPTRANGR